MSQSKHRDTPFCLRLCACLIAAIATFGGRAGAQAVPNRPNIVMIMTDDIGYNEIGYNSALHGGTFKGKTTNLDTLAQQGIVARQAYAAAPLCSTSRAGLLTGQYQNRYGFEENLSGFSDAIAATGTWGLTPQQVTVAQRLKDLGYSTGLVGKWHLGYSAGLNLPTDKGFDEFFGIWDGGRGSYFPGPEFEVRRMRRNNVDWENPANTTQYWGNEGDHDLYDPVPNPNMLDPPPLGRRYATDAFGEEAADFVNRHANDEDPFFLYMPMTAPHEPIEAKAADIAIFSDPNVPQHYITTDPVTDPNGVLQTRKRTIAAMVLAADRAVGKVMSALTANGLDENTIVLFTSDHGGADINDNFPLRGSKGFGWEAGTRVPFILKAPGLTPGQYAAPISFLDVLPTLVSAAGGDISQFPTDGVDLNPYFSGQLAGDPHQVLFMRNFEVWTVRKGQYKLTHVAPGTVGPVLYNVVTDPHEDTNLWTTQPLIAQDLLRELTHWEATLAKPKWGPLSAHTQNDFDHFVFRSDAATTANWSAPSMWRQAGTANNATMNLGDAYPNAIVEIPVRNDADFTATNDLFRQSRQTFMLNQLRLSGEFSGSANRTGNVKGNTAAFQGNTLLLVKNLSGALPQLRLDATSSGTNFGFTFRVSNDFELLDNLEITGNGTQEFVFNGAIRDFGYSLQNDNPPHSVTKSGTSRVTLNGANSFRGSLTIFEGTVRLNAAAASINGPSGISIGSAGSLVLDSGTIAVSAINNFAEGQFDFNGGLLKVVDFTGNLTNDGGNYSPGASPALSTIVGNYVQNPAGKLTMEIGGTTPGTQYDKLSITGRALLNGALQVSLINGFAPQLGNQFDLLLTAGDLDGTFNTMLLPALPGGLRWRLAYSPTKLRLSVAPGSGAAIVTIPGDYNQNGVVDAADFVLWRDTKGSANLAADGDESGTVDDGDYLVWRSNVGHTAPASGSGSASSINAPEPNSLLLTLFASLLLLAGFRASRFDRFDNRFCAALTR